MTTLITMNAKKWYDKRGNGGNNYSDGDNINNNNNRHNASENNNVAMVKELQIRESSCAP